MVERFAQIVDRVTWVTPETPQDDDAVNAVAALYHSKAHGQFACNRTMVIAANSLSVVCTGTMLMCLSASACILSITSLHAPGSACSIESVLT